MIVKKINIKQYKNLKDCEIDINNNQQVLSFIGTNGSGKSNLLEAISILFKDAFIPKSIESKREQYQISLLYNTHDSVSGNFIELSTKNSKINCIKGKENIPPSKFISEQILPKRIVAIYSGESDRLNNKAYLEIYRNYVSKIKESFDLPKMIYLDKSFLDISSLSLLLKNAEEDVIEINQLKIKKTDVTIVFNINTNKLKQYKESKAKKIVESISMQQEYSFDELKQKIENLVKTEEIDKNSIFIYLYSTREVLDKIKISMKINDTYVELDDLSEGEKKKILVKSALECIGTEDTLFLLDEPDAYIHLSNKEELTKIINENKHNSTIILTTHSPTFTKSLSETFPDSIYKMEQNKKIETVSNKIKALQTLCPEQDIFQFLFNISDTLLLVEGFRDVKYIKTAIKFYKEEYPSLKKIDVLPFGGGPNACGFIESLKQTVPDKTKIIVIFDRDDGGLSGINECLSPKQITVNDIKTYVKENVRYLMLPKEIEQSKHIEESEQKKENNDCFVIEDYFSGEKNKEIAKKIVENIKEKIENINPKERGICKYGIYAKNLKNLFKGIKDELVKEEYHTPENMVGFKVLLQKIQNIIEEKEKLEEV